MPPPHDLILPLLLHLEPLPIISIGLLNELLLCDILINGHSDILGSRTRVGRVFVLAQLHDVPAGSAGGVFQAVQELYLVLAVARVHR